MKTMTTRSAYSVTSLLSPKVDLKDRYSGEGNVKRNTAPVLTEQQEKQKREAKARQAAALKITGPSW